MSRNRRSAKKAGTAFETAVATYLAQELESDFIERRRLTGTNDRGDIAGVRDSHNRRIVIETKNYGGRVHLAEWIKEANQEAENDDAHVGLVIAKRRGTTDPGKQWVLMEAGDLVKLLKSPGDVL